MGVKIPKTDGNRKILPSLSFLITPLLPQRQAVANLMPQGLHSLALHHFHHDPSHGEPAPFFPWASMKHAVLGPISWVLLI